MNKHFFIYLCVGFLFQHLYADDGKQVVVYNEQKSVSVNKQSIVNQKPVEEIVDLMSRIQKERIEKLSFLDRIIKHFRILFAKMTSSKLSNISNEFEEVPVANETVVEVDLEKDKKAKKEIYYDAASSVKEFDLRKAMSEIIKENIKMIPSDRLENKDDTLKKEEIIKFFTTYSSVYTALLSHKLKVKDSWKSSHISLDILEEEFIKQLELAVDNYL